MSQTEVQLIKDAVIVNADVSNSAAIDVSKISGAMPLAGGSFTDDVTFTGASANIVFDKSDNQLEFADNAKAEFGTGGDLEIYHESSSNNSFIKNGTGNFEILTDEFRVRNNAASKAFIQSSNNGEIQLFFNGTKRFETTNTGTKVTGIPESREDSTTTDFTNLSLPASSSGLYGQNISGTTGNFFAFTGVAGNASAVSQSGSFIVKSHATQYSPEIHITQRDGNNSQRTSLKITNPGAVELNYAGTKKFETTTNGISVGSVTIDSSFSNIGLPDNGQLRCGTGEDLRIYHLSDVNYISGEVDGKDIYLRGRRDLYLQCGDNSSGYHNVLYADNNGTTRLYHPASDAIRLQTSTTGVTVTGTVTATSFSGSGANLTDVDAGATGGGSDKIFYENGQTVTTNYTIGDTFGAACNAMAAGPITINSGVTVTVNSGETLTII